MVHLSQIENAFGELSKVYNFPLDQGDFHKLLENKIHLAFADQIIYRFSKAQDSMGAKLFKAYLLYQGENVDKPFLDILHSLEKIDLLSVDDWFELREIRNEIAHDYEDNENIGRNILNSIHSHHNKFKNIIQKMAGEVKGVRHRG
jgi:hypothetical protein